MTAKVRKIVGWMVLIFLSIAYVVGSEIYYAHRISPKGIATVHDFFERFGEPVRVRMVERDGQSYYEFTGRLPSAWMFAFPSEAPAYVFDPQGRLSGWCSDPGDIPSYRHTWHLQGTNLVGVDAVRQQFGL